MDIKTMKRIAERETLRYRDNLAYMQGALDAGGDYEQTRFYRCAAWVRAVQGAMAYFMRTDPAKAGFFTGYYHLDRPPTCRDSKRTMAAIAALFHVSESTLYHWRNEALTVVVMAAIQTGALRPYDLNDGKES